MSLVCQLKAAYLASPQCQDWQSHGSCSPSPVLSRLPLPLPRGKSELWCCLVVALLDLPIQPRTEVLGFGLGSSASTQHLPFRFYDQCRRGSSDPTVQRSVFASVDKVPGKPLSVGV